MVTRSMTRIRLWAPSIQSIDTQQVQADALLFGRQPDLQLRVEAKGLEPSNLLTASQALYQLSYAPEGGVRLSAGHRGPRRSASVLVNKITRYSSM